jgi:hypothetical protein
MAETKVYPHGGFQEVIPGVWWVRGSLGFPLYRNMVVARLPSGELLLHSLVALDEDGMRELEALGRPAYAIIPHAHHQMDAPFYQRRYPELQLLCPGDEKPGIEGKVRLSGTAEDALPALGVKVHKVPGTRVKENVYEVPLASGGVVLITNDLFGGAHQGPDTFMGRLMMRLSGVPGGGFGMTRLFRLTQVKDRTAVKRFLGDLAGIPDIRAITVSHGDPVTADPAGRLRALAA